MRNLIIGLAAATMLGIAVPASAQTIYVDDGYRDWWGGPAYRYSDWGGPRAQVYVGVPRARAYVYDDTPRYRYRRYDRSWDDAYAYSSGPYLAYGSGPYVRYRDSRAWDGPYVTVGAGYRSWDRGWWDRW
jgi:hypothetical protein